MATKPGAKQIAIYLEVGQKKTFAGAIDWPGWCRSAKDEEGALAALLDYAPRYAELFARTKVDFAAPDDVAGFTIVERMAGDSSTEFGVPGQAPKGDDAPFDEDDCERAEAILAAIWRAFDRAVAAAEGKALRKGPRGGGRETDAIVSHVLGADAGYLRALGQKFKQDGQAPVADELTRTRAAIRAALRAAVAGEIPDRGRAAARSGRRATTCAAPPGTPSTTPGRSRIGSNSRDRCTCSPGATSAAHCPTPRRAAGGPWRSRRVALCYPRRRARRAGRCADASEG